MKNCKKVLMFYEFEENRLSRFWEFTSSLLYYLPYSTSSFRFSLKPESINYNLIWYCVLKLVFQFLLVLNIKSAKYSPRSHKNAHTRTHTYIRTDEFPKKHILDSETSKHINQKKVLYQKFWPKLPFYNLKLTLVNGNIHVN